MNVPVIAMAMAAGISIDAALTHGLIGATRRPRDPVRIAFAVQAAAVAAGALAAIAAIYAEGTPQTHVAVMKWAFFPAGVVWAVATLWMVAFYTGVRPIRWLAAVSAGFGAVLVLDFVAALRVAAWKAQHGVPKASSAQPPGRCGPARSLRPHVLHGVARAPAGRASVRRGWSPPCVLIFLTATVRTRSRPTA